MSQVVLSHGILLAMGNPLLDISASTENSFLEKWGLKPNDAILAEEKHLPMYQEIVDKYQVEFTAGGSAQNTMRAAQWVIKKPSICSFMGSIGKDKFGDILAEKAKEAGVDARYQRHETIPTGTCAVIITDEGLNRSLCANLAAANEFQASKLTEPEYLERIEQAQYIYITGFFLTVSVESVHVVGRHLAQHPDKLFSMNLSAPFICQFFLTQLMEVLPYVDLLFGNDTEALTLAKELKMETEVISEIALKLAEQPKKNSTRPRRVIITQGHLPIVMAYEGKVTEYPVTLIEKSKVVDTNGAGDAFVGGYLSQLIQGRSIEECIKCAVHVASTVVQQSGCTFPAVCTYGDS